MRVLHLIVCTLFCLPVITTAQQETLFSNVTDISGFGGPFIEVSSINGQVGGDVGGGGALILDNFFIGGYGQGTDHANVELDNIDWKINFNHGGLWFGYVHKDYKLIHLFSTLRLGWGKVKLSAEDLENQEDRIFSVIPELGIEVNLTSFFRLGVTGGYRMVSGVTTIDGIDNNDINSFVGILTFRFGGFDNF